MTADEQAQKIHDVLLSLRFENWHNGKLEKYITGEDMSIIKEDILNDIKELFHLTDSK